MSVESELYNLKQLDLKSKIFISEKSNINHLSFDHINKSKSYGNGRNYIHPLINYNTDIIDEYNLSRIYKYGGSCIAGEFVCRQVFHLGATLEETSVDVFFWGLNKQEIFDLIKVICKDINIKYSYRTKYGVYVITDNLATIQFVLKTHKSENEIVNSFDMDSLCAIISYNNECYVSERGKNAFETRTNSYVKENIVDIVRVLQYMKLGFSFLIPNIDLEKVRKTNKLPKYLDKVFRVVTIINHSINVRNHEHVSADYCNHIDFCNHPIVLHSIDTSSGIFREIITLNIDSYIRTGEVEIMCHENVNELIDGVYIRYNREYVCTYSVEDKLTDNLKSYKIYEDDYLGNDDTSFLLTKLLDEITGEYFEINVNVNSNKLSPYNVKDLYGDYHTDNLNQSGISIDQYRYFKNYEEVEYNKYRNYFNTMIDRPSISQRKINDTDHVHIVNNNCEVSSALLFFNFMRLKFKHMKSGKLVKNIYEVYEHYSSDIFESFLDYLFDEENVYIGRHYYEKILHIPSEITVDKNFIKLLEPYVKYLKLGYNNCIFELHHICTTFSKKGKKTHVEGKRKYYTNNDDDDNIELPTTGCITL